MLLDNKVLLAKCVTLLYRESLLPNVGDNSFDLVRNAMKDVTVNDNTFGFNTEKNIVNGLKTIVLDLISGTKEGIDLGGLLQQIKISCDSDESLYSALEQALKENYSDSSLRKSIVILRRQLDTHFREKEIADEFKKASNKIVYGRDEIKDLNAFINDFWVKIEPLTMSKKGNDPAVMNHLVLGNTEEVRAQFREIAKTGSNVRVYKTLFNGFNMMTQGGLRVQTSMHHALSHNYKTGLFLTLISQILRCNKPFTVDPNKIPCFVIINFEDETNDVINFLFLQMKYSEDRIPLEVDDNGKIIGYTSDEIIDYVTSKFEKNGWKVIIRRVDPTQWSYKDAFNFIITLEAEGYSVEGLGLNYLAMLPTTGCIQGANGEALLDMIRRFRNFCMAKGILFLTPHQMSTDAKTMLRGQTTDSTFVKDVSMRGFSKGSKQLDNELDLEFYHHIAKQGKSAFLTVQRGKHRIPTIIEDTYKFFVLKFTHPKMPIPDDRPEDLVLRRIGNSSHVEGADEELLIG